MTSEVNCPRRSEWIRTYSPHSGQFSAKLMLDSVVWQISRTAIGISPAGHINFVGPVR